jgi:hypothetical protein
MAEKIDTEVWVTQQSLASELGVKVQCVHNWIKRNKIASKKIPGSRLVLVSRINAPIPGQRKNV